MTANWVFASDHSRGGRFLAVTVSFWSEDRAHHDAAYARLRAHPAVKWTL